MKNNKPTTADGVEALLASGGQSHHDQIAKIVDEHIVWLAQFARAALIASDGKRSLPKSRAFISWYRHAALELPHEQAIIDRLAVLHDQLHKAAAHALTSTDSSTLGTDAYDQVITKFNAFMTPLRAFEHSFAAMAHGVDTQTGFASRYRIINDLGAEQKRSARSGQPLTVAYGRVDKYDEIHTLHGPETCAKAITTAADCILKTLRAYDCAYRLGQNSFVLCLKRASLDDTVQVIKRLQECLAKEDVRLFGGSTLNFTVSFAVSAVAHDSDVAALLRLAEDNLYTANTTHGHSALLTC